MHTHLSPPGSLSPSLSPRNPSYLFLFPTTWTRDMREPRHEGQITSLSLRRGPRDVRETSVGKKEKLDIPFLFLPFRLSFPFIDRS